MTQIDNDWWRGAVIYQIYPRSFCDADGDGVGDLAGITGKLDYIADLGVDAIWLSPFFRSPMKDFGYDVSDYRDVDPLFGSLGDFDRMLERAHQLGLKVLIDQVLSHTSDEHPWFTQSRQSRNNPKADWYVWVDPKPDGSAPNNWQAVFGGTAWTWESRRKQYYLHNFLTGQPDLNFHNPAVQEQVLSDVEFWLKRGVDGFRLDTVNFYLHDDQLRDNPPREPRQLRNNPYDMQHHLHDKNQPGNLAFLRKLRTLTDRYPGSVLMGEVGEDERGLEIMAEYTSGGDKLHMAYSFDLLGEESGAGYVVDVERNLESRIGDGWPCWSLSNHDVARFATRWGGEAPDPAWIKVTLATLLSLRGSVCLYEGDELGLPEADVPFDRLQDPFGIAFWPEIKGRDGARTPMPWQAEAPFAGFSVQEPWLPIPEEHRALAADRQCADGGSVRAFCRNFLHWRRNQDALRQGDLRILPAPDGVVAFERRSPSQRLVALLNLSDGMRQVDGLGDVRVLDGHGFAPVQPASGSVQLPPYGACFAAYDS